MSASFREYRLRELDVWEDIVELSLEVAHPRAVIEYVETRGRDSANREAFAVVRDKGRIEVKWDDATGTLRHPGAHELRVVAVRYGGAETQLPSTAGAYIGRVVSFTGPWLLFRRRAQSDAKTDHHSADTKSTERALPRPASRARSDPSRSGAA